MGEFANPTWVKVLAWAAAGVILSLGLWLAVIQGGPWIIGAAWRMAVFGPLIAGVFALLGWISFYGVRPRVKEQTPTGAAVVANLPEPVYRRILVPLNHSVRDRAAIAHAAAMARLHGATLHFLHVEEGVTSLLFGAISSTAEIQAGEEYFEGIVQSLAARGFERSLPWSTGTAPKTRSSAWLARLSLIWS